MALVNKQYLANRLAARFGVRVSVGIHKWIEDIRDPKTGKVIDQVVHNEGEKFTRADGVEIAQADIDAELPAAEAEEAAEVSSVAARAARKQALHTEADADNFIERLRTTPPDQIKAWCDANLTMFTAPQRAVLGRLAVAVAFALNGGTAK